MSKKSIQKVAVAFGYAAWTATAFLTAGLAVSIPLEQFASQQLIDWLSTALGSLTLAAVIYALAALLVALPLFLRRVPWREILGKLAISRRFKGKMFAWALYGWLLYFLTSAAAALVLSLINLPGVNLQQQQEVGFQNLANGFEYIAAFVALVVVAPIFEETIFRGYLFGRIRQRSGFWLSAIVTSLTFALLHGQVNVGIDVFILSMFLSMLRERFDSIWPGVMVHALKNGLAYTFLFILPLFGVKLL